ncbi:hypothetical protein [Granulicella tundricola]|uniref:hypothetical protein n=1 Tax=Granulicella tundricola TaxID=940615 RepID=UPI001E63C0C8|nr:hypothetical protein [Granulicella tundricola]
MRARLPGSELPALVKEMAVPAVPVYGPPALAVGAGVAEVLAAMVAVVTAVAVAPEADWTVTETL